MLGRSLASRTVGLVRQTRCRLSTQPAKATEEAVTKSGGAATSTRRRALPPPLVVTPNAASRIKELLEGSDDAKGVLLGVKRRGCNGMSYTLNYAEEVPDTKHERVECDGAVVWIEPPALFHIARRAASDDSRVRPFLFFAERADAGEERPARSIVRPS